MPLTEEQEKAGTRQLRQWLENDKRLVSDIYGSEHARPPRVIKTDHQVTFRDVSRAVGCHVDSAKK
jgi:hypothetical protein